ncbi:DNA double-strand break repair ATPase Rad50 [Desulfothermus naphthae]
MIKLNSIHLINYLVHRDFVLEFGYPIYELKEHNEFGKSTILSAITDAFSLNPASLMDKSTKGSNKGPVIELDFELNKNPYTIILNSQDNSVLLKGKDGTYLSSPNSIKAFFQKHGFNLLSYVVKNLLHLQERDLSINADSAEFRKFTKDILNVEKINQLIGITDKILLKNKGFKAGEFKKIQNKLMEKAKNLQNEIISLEHDFEKYSKNLERYNNLSKEIEKITKKIKNDQNTLDAIKLLMEYKRKIDYEEKLDKNLKEIDQIKNQLQELDTKIKNLENEYKEKDKYLQSLLIVQKKKENLEQKKKELSKLEKLKEDIKNSCIDLSNKNKEIKRTRDDLSSKIKEIENILQEIDDKYTSLQDKIKNISINKEKLSFISQDIAKLENEIKKAENIKSQLDNLKSQIKDYLNYDINFLKKLFTDVEVFEGLIKGSKGTIQVQKGSIYVNDKLLNEGDLFLFEGEAVLAHDKFCATVVTNEEILNIKSRLDPFFKDFKSKEYLKDVIKKLEQYKNINLKYSEIDLNKINQDLNRLLNDKVKIEKDISIEEKLLKEFKDLKEKEKALKKELQSFNKKIRQIEKDISKNNGMIAVKEKDLQEIDDNIQVLRLEIDKLFNEIDKNGFTEISLDDIEDKINTNKNHLKNITEKTSKFNYKKSALSEKVKFLQNEAKAIKKELEKLKDIDSKINNLPFGLVKKYDSYEVEKLEDLEHHLDNELKRATANEKKLSAEYSELKGILTHVPDKKVLEEKRSELNECMIKLSALDRIEKILRGSRQVMELLRKMIEEKYLSSLSQTTTKYFSEITRGKYVQVIYNDSTIYSGRENFSRAWSVVSNEGVTFDFDELSDGAKTQLLLAVRLALISTFFGNNIAFLLLDEPFAYFDYQRIEKTRNLLESLANKGWQIILVSAKV